MRSKGSPTHARGARAGKNAPPTPRHRLEIPRMLEARMARAFPAGGRKQDRLR